MTEPVTFKYRAFISYSHDDTSWARWLHRALEGFRIDKDLVGRETAAGTNAVTSLLLGEQDADRRLYWEIGS